jgi:hypothetical protein
MGHLRLLRITLKVLLGPTPSPDHHTIGATRRARARWRQDRRTRHSARHIAFNPELHRPGQVLIGDKGYWRASFETELAAAGMTLIRPTFGSEQPRPHQRFLRPFRQIIESVNQTLKAQLDLERHGARTKPGVCARILQRLLALTAAIWHNETVDRPGPARSLLAYDH